MTARLACALLVAGAAAGQGGIEWGQEPIARLGQGSTAQLVLLGADLALGRAVLIEQGLRAQAWRVYARLVLQTTADARTRAAAHAALGALDDRGAEPGRVQAAVAALLAVAPVPPAGTPGPFAWWRRAAESVFGRDPALAVPAPELAVADEPREQERVVRAHLEARRAAHRPGSLGELLAAALQAYHRDTKLLEGMARQDPRHPLAPAAGTGAWTSMRMTSLGALLRRTGREDLSRPPEVDRRHSLPAFEVVAAFTGDQLVALQAFHDCAQRAGDALWASVIEESPDLGAPPPALATGDEVAILARVLALARERPHEAVVRLVDQDGQALDQLLGMRAWPERSGLKLFGTTVPVRAHSTIVPAAGAAFAER